MIGKSIYLNDFSWLKSLCILFMYSLLSNAKRGSFRLEAGLFLPRSLRQLEIHWG